MFGATGSVYGFLLVSRALWFLVNKLLLIPSCFYFDDFPHFSMSKSAKNVKLAFETFLDALGWQYAGGDKNLPFDASFNILGGRINLEHLSNGNLTVENKPGRLEHIAELVKHFEDDPTGSSLYICSPWPCQFCQWLLFGTFSDAYSGFAAVGSVCWHLVGLLGRSKPGSVACIHEGPPIIVFTDAAF